MRRVVALPSHLGEKEASLRLIPTLILRLEPRASSPRNAASDRTVEDGYTVQHVGRVYPGCVGGVHTRVGIPYYIPGWCI